MALKFNIQASASDIESAKSQAPSGRYSGPTPPPDLYNLKLVNLASGEDARGNPRLVAALDINETGDKAVYNGARIFDNLAIPTDTSYEHFAVQVNVLDSFLRAVSGGAYDIDAFIKDANAGKIITEGENKKGDPFIKSIGKFKLDKAVDVTAKTRIRSWNGNDYVNVHFYDTSKITAAKPSEDASADDLDDLLG